MPLLTVTWDPLVIRSFPNFSHFMSSAWGRNSVYPNNSGNLFKQYLTTWVIYYKSNVFKQYLMTQVNYLNNI